MENHEDIIEIRVEGREEEEEARDEGVKFKQFDIIPAADGDDDNKSNSISDHYYALSYEEPKYSNQTTKRIMKEWKILEESLPDLIYVRAYERRIDLLRAVIVGASGTPYQDGLYFFDIKFPLDYPSQPPEIHYHSYGFRLNRNLYGHQWGKVCISLLNTSGGSVDQRWNPSKSTVLQVLVSIQALVLNSKPYFNELPSHITDQNLPSYITDREKESLAYNEETFVLSCKKMLAVINKPPRHFESFVAQHFRDRAETILTTCKAYIDDVHRIVKDVVSGDQLIQTNTVSSSAIASKPKRYQKLMKIIYTRLVKAFIKNGSSFLGNSLGSYMDVDENFIEPRLRGEMQHRLSDLIFPLFMIFLLCGWGPCLYFIYVFDL